MLRGGWCRICWVKPVRCICIEKPGGYNRLNLQTRPKPTCGPEEYLVETQYVGVNYADIIIREGYYAAAKGRYPIVPGFEYAGTVVAKGENCTQFNVGDAVCGVTLFGGYASHIVAKSSLMRKIPKGFSFQDAAALLVPHLTAYHALHHVAHVQAGETLLIHSAAGGVGQALVQQGLLAGCKIIAVVGQSEKLSILPSHPDVQGLVKSRQMWHQLPPEGVDVIFDANGLTTPKPGFRALNTGGRLVIYGFAEVFPRGKRPFLPSLLWKALHIPKFNLGTLTVHNRSICGFNLAFLMEKQALAGQALDHIMAYAAQGDIAKPAVTTFPLTDTASAHKLLESGQSTGRVVLKTQ